MIVTVTKLNEPGPHLLPDEVAEPRRAVLVPGGDGSVPAPGLARVPKGVGWGAEDGPATPVPPIAARERRRRLAAGGVLHHRGRDPVRRGRPAAGHPLAHGRLRSHRQLGGRTAQDVADPQPLVAA